MVTLAIGSIQESKLPAKAVVIWMHGLGAESTDMEMLVQNLPLSDLPLRHIFLDAPIRPVTLNGGIEMRAWFDIMNGTLTAREDEAGIFDSEQSIRKIIEDQIAQGIPAKAIYLAGFSQGGAMALHTGLHYPEPLAGIAALSAYLPLSKTKNQIIPSIQAQTPIFMAGGLQDKIVHYNWTKASQLHLEEQGCQQIDFHAYPMEHCVCLDEIHDLSAWIRKCFKSIASPV